MKWLVRTTLDRYEIEYYDGYKALIATDNFYQGETIIVLPKATLPEPDRYSLEVSPGVHIDCSDSPVGSINHSCRPNAAVRNGRIVVWECIKVGDSITIDYRRTETKMAVPFYCECDHCEGEWIDGRH